MYKWLLFLLAYLPFQIALNPSQDIDLASIRVFILFFFIVWLAESLRKKELILRKSSLNLVLFSFFFLSFFSSVFSQNIEWSLRKVLFLFSIYPIYFIVSTAADSREKILRSAKIIVFSGLIVSSVGLVQFFSQFIFGINAVYKFWADNVVYVFLGKSFSKAVLENPSWLVNVSGHNYLRAISVFPDPHMLSFFLGIFIPVSLGLFFEAKSRKEKAFFSIAFLVSVLCDFLTFSRGGYLGLFGGALFALFYFWKDFKLIIKISSATAILLALFLIISPNSVSKRLFSSFDFNEGSNKGRIETWDKALGVIEKNPFFGVGIGNYSLEIKPTAGYREPIYAHNAFLDIMAESGIITGILWSASLFLALSKFLAKKERIFNFFAVSILIFSLHSLVETPIYSPVVFTLIMVILGFSEVQIKKNEKKV